MFDHLVDDVKLTGFFTTVSVEYRFNIVVGEQHKLYDRIVWQFQPEQSFQRLCAFLPGKYLWRALPRIPGTVILVPVNLRFRVV